MPEMQLKQPGFTYSTCGPFTKNRERIQKLKKETGDTRQIYKNELNKTCFLHDMAYADFKDLVKRTASDTVLRDKAFNIAKNPKYDGYQKVLLLSMVDKFLIKKKKNASGSGIKNEIKQNEQFAEELHKPIKNFQKKKSIFIIHRQYYD